MLEERAPPAASLGRRRQFEGPLSRRGSGANETLLLKSSLLASLLITGWVGPGFAAPEWDLARRVGAQTRSARAARSALLLPKTTVSRQVGEFVLLSGTAGEFDIDWAHPLSLTRAVEATVNGYYQAQSQGDPQFLVVFTTFDTPGRAPFYAPFANAVRGLGHERTAVGREVFDFSAGVGLEGVVFMGSFRQYLDDPATARFIFNQELAHRWGAFVWREGPDGDDDILLGRDCAHWSFFVDSGGSALEGNRWRELEPGRFVAEPVTDFGYQPLDQYLMGLRRAADVPPIRVLNPAGGMGPCRDRTIDGADNPSWLPPAGRLGQAVEWWAQPTWVDINQVVALHGPRVPAVGSGRFSAHFVVLTRARDVIGPESHLVLDTLRLQLVEGWEAAAGAGLAERPTLESSLQGDLASRCGSGDCIPPEVCVRVGMGAQVCATPCQEDCPSDCVDEWCLPGSTETDAGATTPDTGSEADSAVPDLGRPDIASSESGPLDVTPRMPRRSASSSCSFGRAAPPFGWTFVFAGLFGLSWRRRCGSGNGQASTL